MTMERNELLSKLKKCLPGIDKGPTALQGANCFVFQQDRLITFNDYISVSVPLQSDMDCAVPALDFYKVLNSFKAKEIELTLTDFNLNLKCGKALVSVPLMEEKILTRIDTVFPTDIEWTALSANFKNALALGYLRSGNTQISGVFIDNEKLISTDQIVIVEVDMIPPMERCWLSNKMIVELLKYPSFQSYAMNASWIHFKNDDMTFSCRKLMDANYPKENVMGMLESFKKGDMIYSGVLNTEVQEALRSATVFAEETDAVYMVNFAFTANNLLITSKKHTGSFSQEIEVEASGEDVSFHVDALKLCSILSYAPISFQILKKDGILALYIFKDTWSLLMGVNG